MNKSGPPKRAAFFDCRLCRRYAARIQCLLTGFLIWILKKTHIVPPRAVC
jgi:hypothetical protein